MKKVLQTLFILFTIQQAFGQAFRTPTLTGNAFTDFTANERVFFGGGGNYNVTWDINNLYIGVGGLGTYIKDEPTQVYLDTDPQLSPFAGTGSTTGFNSYDGRIGTLPFTANLVLYLKSNYAEVRTNTAGSWTAAGSTYNNVTANIVTGTNDIEITIPWSMFPGGTRPLSMRSIFYKHNGNGGSAPDAYNIMPGDLYIPNINTTAFTQSFTQWNTNTGIMANTMTSTCVPPMITATADATLDFNDYRGTGFATMPLASIGQLCTNTWATTGLSDGAKAFGSTTSIVTTGDHARGARNAAVTTGGLYGGNRGGGDYAFWIQPSADDVTPGTVTLRVQNKTGAPMTGFQIMYDLLEFNDQPRENTFNFSYSSDDVAYTPVVSLNHTTTAAAAAAPTIQVFPKSAIVSSVSVPNNGFLYLRWSSDDTGTATGSRDEIGLDNIIVKKLVSSPYCYPAGASCPGGLNNHLRDVKLINQAGTTILQNTTNACNNNGYTFFNALTIPKLTSNLPYNFEIEGSAPGDFGNYAIWIDYNGDFDFDDAGELVASNTTNGATASNSGVFTVPAAAVPGNTRMRVAFGNVGFPATLNACNNDIMAEYEDYTVEITACSTPVVALCKNLTITMNTASITIPAADLNNNSTGCAPLTFSTANNTFTCADLGTKTLTLTVTDANSATNTCVSTITVKDGAACSGAASIKDPCLCKAPSTNLLNGQFSDVVEITSVAGQTWRVQSVSGYFQPSSPAPPAAPIPFAVGAPIPYNAATGKYTLEGVHVDAIGYALVAERVDAATGTVLQTLSIGNRCYFPTPAITALGTCYTKDAAPVTLTGADAFGGTGTSTFTIDGAPATTLNPATLSLGTHIVELTFDAGNYTAATGINPPITDPGCIEKVTKEVQITDAGSNTLSCYDNITLDLQSGCSVTVLPTQVLTTGNSCVPNLTVKIFNGLHEITQPLNATNVNKIYTYKLINPTTGNFCWGTLKVEDKDAPIITCPVAPIDANCEEIASLEINEGAAKTATASVRTKSGNVSVFDCSSPNITFTYTDQVEKKPCTDLLSMVIKRTFKAVDAYGNTAECLVTINVKRRTLAEVIFPSSYTEACTMSNMTTILPSASGSPYIGSTANTILANNSCDFTVAYTDTRVNTCGNTYEITREWVVLDCNGNFRRSYQTIFVKDLVPPAFTNCDTKDIYLGMNGANCDVDGYTPKLPKAQDNCGNQVTVVAEITNASNVVIIAGPTFNNIPEGIHILRFTATDGCGNTSTCTQRIFVEDKTPPVAVCDLNTIVSLTNDGKGIINAIDLTDGSTDNCCLDINAYQIKRAADPESAYAPTLAVDCNDKNLMVNIRVADCKQNSNVCMVNVTVLDKLAPVAFGRDTVVCCASTPVATAWLNANPLTKKTLIDLPNSTNPGYYDNCDATATPKQEGSIDNCGNGTVKHTWTVTDKAGNSTSTVVNYISENRSAYMVEFPDDTELTCNSNKVYATDPAQTGKPVITPYAGTCPLVGIDYEDEIIKVVPDACFKIIRRWKVLNWCQPLSQDADRGANFLNDPKNKRGEFRKFYNIHTTRPNNSSVFATGAPCKNLMDAANAAYPAGYDEDGYMEYVQIIKVVDNTPPTIVAGEVKTEAVGKECKTRLTIAKPTSTDCTNVIAESYEIVKTSNNAVVATGTSFPVTRDFTEGEFGDYIVRYKANDQCGNIKTADVAVTIKDIKKPTPVCHHWISVELMANKMVMLDAKVLDAGSYDNCTPTNKLTYKIQVPAPTNLVGINPDTMKTFYNFVCPPAGTVPNPLTPNAYTVTVALWVGDEAGNWDYCETAVTVQDNMDICGYTPIQMKPVIGEIMTEKKKEVENVMVKLEGMKQGQLLTTPKGYFKFLDLPVVGEYTVTPEKDNFPLNGVSTLDLVLISKHVLATQLLTSPYQLIAADVNKNGAISTADIVELRKMILAIQPNFTKNKSWRFVPSDFTFADPTNPFAATFPESKELKGLGASAEANFVAIKVGDINGNANPADLAAGRNDKSTMLINTNEQTYQSGDLVKVNFDTKNINDFLGYQMTVAYDKNALELVNIEGNTENFATPEVGFVTMSQVNSTANAPYQFVFKAKRNGTLSEAVSVGSRFTTAEAYDNRGETHNLAINFVGAQKETITLYQNRPNPFGEATVISFNLPQADNAKIVITDINGRTIKTIEKSFAKGYNEVNVSRNELGSTGIFYYRLETSEQNITKKMIVVE